MLFLKCQTGDGVDKIKGENRKGDEFVDSMDIKGFIR